MQEYFKKAERLLRSKARQAERAQQWLAHAEEMDAKGEGGKARKARNIAKSIMDGDVGAQSKSYQMPDAAGFVEAQYEGTLKE